MTVQCTCTQQVYHLATPLSLKNKIINYHLVLINGENFNNKILVWNNDKDIVLNADIALTLSISCPPIHNTVIVRRQHAATVG